MKLLHKGRLEIKLGEYAVGQIAALTNPLLGYVKQPLRIQAVENFQPELVGKFADKSPGLLALYSRSWDPAHGWQRWPPAARLLERYFAYRPQISPDELQSQFDLRAVAHWERRGQWMTIFAPAGGPAQRPN